MLNFGGFENFGKLLDRGNQNELGNIFDGMFPMRSEISGFMPLAIPVMQSNTMFPFTIQPGRGMIENRNSCGCGCGNNSTKVSDVEVDEEMSKRRELNAQMRAAVEKEDFEKAAELRDQIKALEAQAKEPKQTEIPAQTEKTAQEPLQGEGA